MKKLNGHVYLYPAPQIDIDALTEYDSECKTYHFISGLLGLSAVPEKWVKVCALDEDCFDEDGNVKNGKSGDWHYNGYTLEGCPGIAPFPDYLPADFFKGKKENDTLSFRYGDMHVNLALKQLAYDSKNALPFEEVFYPISAASSPKAVLNNFSELPPLKKPYTAPPKQKKTFIPIFLPITAAALAAGPVGIACIAAAGVALAAGVAMSTRRE